MLDFFTIFSRGGIVLWCFADHGHHIESFAAPVNYLIKSIILQDRAGEGSLNHENLTVKFKLDNEFELVFVVGYQKIVGMSFYDKFLSDVQREFRDRYKNQLRKNGYLGNYEGFTEIFMALFQEAKRESDKEAKKPKAMKSFHQSEKSKKTVASMIVLKDDPQRKVNTKGKGDNKAVNGNIRQKPNKKESNDKPFGQGEGNIGHEAVLAQRDTHNTDIEANRAKMMARRNKKSDKIIGNTPSQTNLRKTKRDRKWEANHSSSESKLNYGEERRAEEEFDESIEEEIALKKGQMCGDLPEMDVDEEETDEEEEEEEEEEKQEVKQEVTRAQPTSQKQSSGGGFGFFSSLRSLVGSKALTAEDLMPVLTKLKEHIIGKNVAAEVADKLCESLSNKLEGKVLGTFTTVSSKAKEALEEACLQLLQPKRRIDILRDCISAQEAGRPYVITFCGVNGVGKSTNLAKVCFWLIENRLRVLIAACDTFRAGAVEQLKTHVRKLNALHPPEQYDGQRMVLLYEKGYNKDAAGIAMEAINHARDTHIDVVLVDTAGRMQDNEPLMRALSKLIAVNQPDLTLFVGEALVGNDAVDQLVKFNQALADHSNMTNPRLIDGIVLTKFDTIDDKVGAAVSMTYITGQPIVFVGTGQTYTDLKKLNAKAVVQSLLR